MGRVTIFTRRDCARCSLTTGAFSSRNIPYVEISLSCHPELQDDMFSLSNSETVPQVFFNDIHVGGASETQKLLEAWDQDERYSNALEKYLRTVASKAGPSNPRLGPTSLTMPQPRSQMAMDSLIGLIPLVDGSKKLVSVGAMTAYLMKEMPRSDLTYRARIYKDCFTGRDGVKALVKVFNLEGEQAAIDMGRSLQRKEILHHVTGDHAFGSTENFFRLQPFHNPKVLNSFCVWTDVVNPDPMNVLSRLEKLLQGILSCVTDRHGVVDFVRAEKDPDFLVFEEAVCELQGIYLGEMKQPMKRAIWIRLYNLMITHAYIKVGVASNAVKRMAFFRTVSYDIGGHILSLNDLEHGVLRGNRQPPCMMNKVFKRNDPRYHLSLKNFDPRIHFAISFSKAGCPWMKGFTGKNIDQDLQMAAEAYCMNDKNVSIDFREHLLSLSLLFYWYRSDFARSESTLPHAIVQFLRGEKKQTLTKMISRGWITVKFFPKRNIRRLQGKPFEKRKLEPNELTMKALFIEPKKEQKTIPYFSGRQETFTSIHKDTSYNKRKHCLKYGSPTPRHNEPGIAKIA